MTFFFVSHGAVFTYKGAFISLRATKIVNRMFLATSIFYNYLLSNKFALMAIEIVGNINYTVWWHSKPTNCLATRRSCIIQKEINTLIAYNLLPFVT